MKILGKTDKILGSKVAIILLKVALVISLGVSIYIHYF